MASVLTDKQYKASSDLTRYSSFPIYYNTKDEKYIMHTTANLNTSTSYSKYKVKNGDTLDIIAYKFYQNPVYYWAIADFNRIKDPFTKLEVGSIIKIPELSKLEYISVGV